MAGREDQYPDWALGALAAQDAYRGPYEDWQRPATQPEGPPSQWSAGVQVARDIQAAPVPQMPPAPGWTGNLREIGGRMGDIAQAGVNAADQIIGAPSRGMRGENEYGYRPDETTEEFAARQKQEMADWAVKTAFGETFYPRFGRNVGGREYDPSGGSLLGSGAVVPSGRAGFRMGEAAELPRPANTNPAQAEVISGLPPPLTANERIYNNYVRSLRMTPDEMLKSEPVWSTAANLAQERGMPPHEAFAQVVNDMYQRMGANQYITPQQAKLLMARERGQIVPVENEPLPPMGSVADLGGGMPEGAKLSPAQKRTENERAFERARFQNKLRAVRGEQQVTEFTPPHPEFWGDKRFPRR
jgi:hypothetical protein